MNEPDVYLEKISAFSRMLRLEGLPVSPKEAADAAQILCVLGFEDREQVKTALRTVFAKSREEQLAFDRVFDGFFISEDAMRAQAQKQMEREREVEEARRQAEQELETVKLTDDQLDTYAAMPDEARQKLRRFLERYRDSAERNPELYNNFIHSVFTKTILEQQMLMEDAAIGAEAADPELGLLFRDISDFKDTELPKAISMIQTISRQINGELTAKKRKGSHSGKLDFRRTIRKGLETGGSLYRLKYKKKRSRRRHLVLLCDVSGSMVQFRSLLCGLSNLSIRWRKVLGCSYFLRKCLKRMHSAFKIWIFSGIMCVSAVFMERALTWAALWKSSALPIRLC